MTNLTFKNIPINTVGNLPSVGDIAPDFKLMTSDLSEISLSYFKGKRVLFNIFPSIDTPVCAIQLRKFSQEVSNLNNVVLLFVSLDLPFAFKRFCASEGITNVVTASDYKHHSIAKNYGVKMANGPLAELYARAVFVLNVDHKIIYRELVHEVTNEPNYQSVIEILK